jgi:hypothetical protein
VGVRHEEFLSTWLSPYYNAPLCPHLNFERITLYFLQQKILSPAVGDPVYSLFFQQASYAAMPEVNKFVPCSADFVSAGLLGGWGIALTPPVTFTNTTTGTAVDEGAQTTNGGAAFLHVLQAAASDTYTIIVEGSATGAFSGEEVTLATFTLDASALGSERIAISGTVHQYLRFKATRTGSAGDTVKIAASLVRF